MKHTDVIETISVTDEQEIERSEYAKRVHEDVALDRFYRLALAAAAQSVNSGMDDEEIYKAGKRVADAWRENSIIFGKKAEPKKAVTE